MTPVLSERALVWCERWGNAGGSIGSDDQGRLVFTAQPGETEAPQVHALITTVHDTPGLAEEIGRVFLLMLQADRPEGTTLQ